MKTTLSFLILLFSTSIYAQPCNYQWAHSLGTYAKSESVTTDAAGNVYVTGYYSGTADFDPGPAIFNLTANSGTNMFIQKLTSNGSLIWAKSCGGSSWDGGYSITTDSVGNIYTAGFYTGMVDFDPGSTTFNLTSNGQADIFIQKLDTSGNFIWAKSIGGTEWDEVNSITTNATGEIYLTGWYSGSADFDPGLATFNLTSNGQSDIFIEKLDANGNFLWAKSIGGGTKDEAESIVTDVNGNIYVTGFFTGTADFDPGMSTFNLTSNGQSDIFIEKLTSSGNFLWAKSIGGFSTITGDIATSIVTDAVGNIYIGGGFSATVDFDPGPGVFNLIEPTNGGSRNIFIEKLTSSGNFVWAKSIGSGSNDFVSAMTIDNLGNLYITGSYFDTVDFDPGPGVFNLTGTPVTSPNLNYFTDIFIEKLDTNGQFIWAKSIGGGKEERSSDIVKDVSGNIYVSGFFYGAVDFDPGVGSSYINGLDTNNMFILRLCNLTSDVIKNSISSNVTIFPNPTTGYLTISIEGESCTSADIRNSLGQLLLSNTFSSTKLLEIDISSFPNGIYFLQLKANGKIITKKIIKE